MTGPMNTAPSIIANTMHVSAASLAASLDGSRSCTLHTAGFAGSPAGLSSKNLARGPQSSSNAPALATLARNNVRRPLNGSCSQTASQYPSVDSLVGVKWRQSLHSLLAPMLQLLRVAVVAASGFGELLGEKRIIFISERGFALGTSMRACLNHMRDVRRVAVRLSHGARRQIRDI